MALMGGLLLWLFCPIKQNSHRPGAAQGEEFSISWEFAGGRSYDKTFD